MFGNIKPFRPELKLKDYSDYRAYYCGLCKSMGAKYAALCRAGLSYEAVFIAIMLSALSDEKVIVKNQGCFMHPFAKRPMVIKNKSVDAAAAVNVLLMYNSLCDNVKDEGDLKSRLAKLWFKGAYKKAVGDMTDINGIINEKLDDLSLTEESLCDVLDRAAEPFSEMMGEIAVRLMPDAKDMYWFGFFMGKWLYIIDAYADIEKDLKSKSYNPFILMYPNDTSDEVAKKSHEDAEFVLKGALSRLECLYDGLDIKRNKDIIENILFEGMPDRTVSVLSGEKKSKPQKEYEML